MEHPCFCLVQMMCLAAWLLCPWSELPSRPVSEAQLLTEHDSEHLPPHSSGTGCAAAACLTLQAQPVGYRATASVMITSSPVWRSDLHGPIH